MVTISDRSARDERRLRLASRDKAKPFVLLGAVLVGLALSRWMAEGVPTLLWVVEAGVFLVILAVMLPVEMADVGRAFQKVRPTALALGINFVFIPAFAWSLGWMFLRPYPDLWAGVILYTLTPCIGWYLIFIDLAQGDLPWGMALLPWNITLQVMLLPVYLYWLVGRVVPVELVTLTRSVVLFLVLPFALSALLRRWAIGRGGRAFFAGPLKRIAGEVKLWALVVVIIAMFVSQPALGVMDLGRVLLVILVITLFFGTLFAVALLAGRLARLSYPETTTLAFTTTARNSEAVIAVAVSAFPGHPIVYFAVILGPIVELPVLLLISRWLLGLRHRLGVPGLATAASR